MHIYKLNLDSTGNFLRKSGRMYTRGQKSIHPKIAIKFEKPDASMHQPNLMQKCPGTFLTKIVNLLLLYIRMTFCAILKVCTFPQGMSINFFA